MDYQEAEKYVLSFTDYEKIPGILYTSTTYDLRRMESLLDRLGNPHKASKSVHIAGTKGKGSTCAMITSVLEESGYNTGMYTSPHFHTLRERIMVNEKPISENDFSITTTKLRPEIEAINRESLHGELTTFEILTAIAFLYFAESKVDYQVLEVGLGGRLDATNVVEPEVCVITSISLDHMEVLGNSIEEIAEEKAGIIKKGCSVVSARQPECVDKIIEKVCVSRDAPLIRIGREISWQMESWDQRSQIFHLKSRCHEYELSIPLLGEYQIDNAACAVAALEVLYETGAYISEDKIKSGLSRVTWPGRLQVIRKDPLVVCDGAHNTDSAAKLRLALQQYFSFTTPVLVIGTSTDKDIKGIIKELSQLFLKVIVTKSHHPRAASTSLLADEFAQYDILAERIDSLDAAILRAISLAGRDGIVCITGSLFIVAEVLEWSKRSSANVDSNLL